MEVLKSVLYIISTAVMAGAIILFPDTVSFTSGFYMLILSTYLGLDIWGMIQKTTSLPKGEYKDIKVSRYVICVIGYLALIIVGYVMKASKGYDYDGMFKIFISAIFVIISLFIGGLEGNKIATDVDGKEKSE